MIKHRALMHRHALLRTAFEMQHHIAVEGDQTQGRTLLAQHQATAGASDTSGTATDLQRARGIHQHFACTQLQAGLPVGERRDHLAAGIEFERRAVGQLPGTSLARAGGV
ncbi:hypothetical protein BW43_01181 [Pseudomonas sp. RIT357]|nr:hypothetical protein BW43_01181 [Pseudomonas sp. RIT357]